MSATTLFVYGTLMRGEPGHDWMAGATRLGPARTAAQYTLVQIQWYPGLLSQGSTSVRGELYSVEPEQLGRITAYEGAEYTLAPVTLDDGSAAQAYLLKPGLSYDYPVIESGDWLDATR